MCSSSCTITHFPRVAVTLILKTIVTIHQEGFYSTPTLPYVGLPVSNHYSSLTYCVFFALFQMDVRHILSRCGFISSPSIDENLRNSRYIYAPGIAHATQPPSLGWHGSSNEVRNGCRVRNDEVQSNYQTRRDNE
jgi:hypothetical protein